MKQSNKLLILFSVFVIGVVFYYTNSRKVFKNNELVGMQQETENDPGSYILADSIDALIKKFVSDQNGKITAIKKADKQFYSIEAVSADKILGPEQGHKQLLSVWKGFIKIDNSKAGVSDIHFIFDLKEVDGKTYMKVPLELLYNLLYAYPVN